MVRVYVGRVPEVPPGSMAEVNVNDRTYVICNVEGELYALDGVCPHRGAPLAHGALHEHTIVCPWHAWEFDCRTGHGDCDNLSTTLVTVDNDCIYLNAGTA
jgi:nitrite reductase (NADH) small subunit